MIQAAAALLFGGVLGRWVLWPLETRLAHRNPSPNNNVAAEIAQLRTDMHQEDT